MSVNPTIDNKLDEILSSLENDVVSDYSKQAADIASIIEEIQQSDVGGECELSESDISSFVASLDISQFDFFCKLLNKNKKLDLMLIAQKMYIKLLQKYINDDEILRGCETLLIDKHHELDVLVVSHEKLIQKDKDDKSNKARFAAIKKHEQKNKAKIQIREIWATGKYSSRDICAEEEECAALGLSFSTARKALRNTPNFT